MRLYGVVALALLVSCGGPTQPPGPGAVIDCVTVEGDPARTPFDQVRCYDAQGNLVLSELIDVSRVQP